jgi:hypothetical protein
MIAGRSARTGRSPPLLVIQREATQLRIGGNHLVAATFDKLNLKDQETLVVIDPPRSFAGELRQLKGVKIVRNTQGISAVDFAIAFVTQREQVERAAGELIGKLTADAVLWFAYPKGTSKAIKSELNRDTGWDVLRSAGFDTVRLVALDADWSALRFRRNAHIGHARHRSDSGGYNAGG